MRSFSAHGSCRDVLDVKFLRGQGFPGGSVVKNPAANAEVMGLIPGPGRYHMLQGN